MWAVRYLQAMRSLFDNIFGVESPSKGKTTYEATFGKKHGGVNIPLGTGFEYMSKTEACKDTLPKFG